MTPELLPLLLLFIGGILGFGLTIFVQSGIAAYGSLKAMFAAKKFMPVIVPQKEFVSIIKTVSQMEASQRLILLRYILRGDFQARVQVGENGIQVTDMSLTGEFEQNDLRDAS